MTGTLLDPHLDLLEQRFQALRDQIGAMPEACRPELETALQELSQAIAALRADREAGNSPQPDPPSGREAQAHQSGKELLNQILLDALPCVALLLRPGTREIVASNAEAVKAGALPGTQCFATWRQRQEPCPWCRAPAVWATGKAQHLEVEALGVTWEAYWIPVAEDLYMHFAFDVTARKQAEREIQRLVSFPQMNPQPVLEMDIDGRITYYNQAALKALGERGTAEDLKNFLPDDLQEILATAKQIGERHFHREVVVNSAVFLEDIYFAEQFNGVRLYALDITARKQAEAELIKKHAEFQETAQRLEQSRNMLQLIIESIPVRVFWKDKNLRYMGCNTPFARDAGFNHPQELLGRDDFAMGWREQADLYQTDDLQVMESRRPKLNIVEPQTTPAGANIWLSTNKVPLQMPNGEVFGVLGVYEDVTERQQAAEALRESEATLRTLIESNPESLFLLDTRGLILAASRVAAQRLGKSLEDIIGADLHDMLPYEVSKKRFEIMQGVAATGQPARFEDVRGNFYFDNSITPIFDQDKVVQIAVLGVDISLRKQAEQALRESEARFRHISSTISDISYSCTAGPDGSYAIDWLAGAVARITGYSAEEILAQGCWEFLVIEADQPLFERHITGLAAGTSGSCELRLRHQNGGIVWVASFAKIVQEPDQPELLHIYGGLVDITARKQAEAALAAHLQFLQLLLDTIPNPIFFKDAQGAYLGCNKAFENYLGVTRQEIVGKSVYDLSPKELADEYHRMDLEAFQTTGSQFYESRVQAPDGARRQVVFHKATFPDPTGGVGGLVGMITDITGLKQTEAELRQSEQRFRLMAETIQDVFWMATPGIGKTVYVSPAYEHIWGRPCEPLYQNSKLFMEAIHPEDRDRVKSEIIAAREQGIPWSHEYRIIQPDGAGRWIQDRGFPVRDDQGRVIMFTGVATDITERKALEQQLLQAQKMEAVGRLAGGVAHDFNNLLMAITGYGELMRSKVFKDDPLYGYLEHILNAGDRAAALTQQLLTFSRQKIVHPQVIDLNQVVLDLEPMLRRLIGEDLDLEVLTDRRLGAVKADPSQMGQIIMNLVVNARDAMPQGGRVTMKTAPVNFTVGCQSRFGLTPPGSYVMLAVEDTGVGMDEATQAHIFEPFFTTKEPGKGTGLGLSTVYGIVKQSGGYLDLKSSPGAGSTFTIYLPRLEAIVEPPKVKIPLTASFRGEETILLVEDEDVLRSLLAKFLRLYGYTVLEARHGGEALLTCERHPGPIHVMVTDVVMPQMSGRELADRLTPLRPEMKVLYMSGYTEEALVQHGVADLSVAFLQKPFKPIELARRVYAVLHPPVSQ